jgi:hypothetical protein
VEAVWRRYGASMEAVVLMQCVNDGIVLGVRVC